MKGSRNINIIQYCIMLIIYPCRFRMVSIDVVYAVAGIEIVVRRDRRTDVGDAERSAKVCCIIEYLELVVMRVSEELGRDC